MSYHVSGAHQPLPVRLEGGVYRITQEALANVEQHAGAQQVKVQLAVTPGSLELAIEDNGRGFRPEAMPEGRYGLIGINERVRLMGGKLDLQSTPRAGTHLKITIPLEQET